MHCPAEGNRFNPNKASVWMILHHEKIKIVYRCSVAISEIYCSSEFTRHDHVSCVVQTNCASVNIANGQIWIGFGPSNGSRGTYLCQPNICVWIICGRLASCTCVNII